MALREGNRLRMMIDTEDPLFLGQKKIKIQGRELAATPPELFNLIELEVLDMSPEREACLHYKMTDIPSAIGKLVNLTILLLDTNDLTSIPPEICYLVKLERLALSNNLLTNLPSEMAKLKNLNSLHLANNKFNRFPQCITKLYNLQFLDLSDNLIQRLPVHINNLKKLETLLLFENKISFLPNEICDLVLLRCLWVGNNQLRHLPIDFGKLKLLDWSWHYTSTTLDGNPLIHPPLEVCKRGNEQISQYLTGMSDTVKKMMLKENQMDQANKDADERYDKEFETNSNEIYQAFVEQSNKSNVLDIDPSAMRLLRRGSAC